MSEEIVGLRGIKKILAVASGKGGVGKSTVASNLAVTLGRMGYQVGLLDADIYGPSQVRMMGNKERIKGKNGQIIPLECHGIRFVSMGSLMEENGSVLWRAPIVNRVLSQFLNNVYWGELDYLILDLPPGTGDIHITIAQQAQIDGCVIVTTPQAVASEIAYKGLKMFEEVHVPILGVVENMSSFKCSHCQEETTLFSKGGGEDLAQKAGTKLLGKIPLHPSLMLRGDSGNPLSDGAVQDEMVPLFDKLTQNILDEEKRLADEFAKIAPRNVQVGEGGANLEVDFGEGIKKIESYYLRTQCPCASCVEETTGKRILDPQSVSLGIKLVSARPVGRYGLSLQFSDKHGTGIYRYSFLKELIKNEGSEESSFSV